MFIHQGFDNDDNLKYSDIVLNIAYINNHAYDDLVDADHSDSPKTSEISEEIISDMMSLQYLIKCRDHSVCGYMTEGNSSIGMDHSVFETFVTTKLRSYFTPMDATTYSSNSALIFAVNDINITATTDSMAISSSNMTGFDSATIVLISVFCMVILSSATCSVFAFITVHRRRPGTDRPNYLSLFKFGFNVADFYTDVIWTLTLVFEASEYARYAMLFTFGSYGVSMIVGISYVIIWKSSRRSKLYLSGYADRYGKFVLIGTALAGFYSTMELITSHLGHLSVFSLHLSKAQHQQTQILRILNVVLLENLPLLIIQFLYLSSTDFRDNQSANLTMITVMFSALSIISGISNIITIIFSRCITDHDRSDVLTKKLLFEFTMKERFPGNIHPYHVHSHDLLRRAMGISLKLGENQVVIYTIQQISDGLMIMGKLKFLSEEQLNNLQDELENKQSEMRINLKRECINHLEIKVARYVELGEIKLKPIGGSRSQHKIFKSTSKSVPQTVMPDTTKADPAMEMLEFVGVPKVSSIGDSVVI